MLAFDSFERPPILSLDSLAVAPLSPVEVGEDWRFLDDDLEGTFNRRPFFEDDPSPVDAISFSLELSWTSWGLSTRSRDISPFEVDDGIYTGSWGLASVVAVNSALPTAYKVPKLSSGGGRAWGWRQFSLWATRLTRVNGLGCGQVSRRCFLE